MVSLPKSLSAASLNNKAGKLERSLSYLLEEVKATKPRLLVTFERPNDPCVRNAADKVD